MQASTRADTRFDYKTGPVAMGIVKKFVSLPVLIDISNALDVSISELFMFKQ